jgi:hypothetical protein
MAVNKNLWIWNELILQPGNGMMKRRENKEIMKRENVRTNGKFLSCSCGNVLHAIMTYLFISVRLLYCCIRFCIMMHDVIYFVLA